MRQYLLAALVGVAGLAVGAAFVVLSRHASETVASAPPPALEQGGGTASVALPPAAAPSPAAVPSDAGPSSAPLPSATADAAPPPAASDLPTVDVAPLTVHTVPDTDSPAASVTVVDRNGRTLRELKPSAGLSPGYVPSVGPGSAASSGGRLGSRPILVPPVANSQLASLPANATFNGRAVAVAGTILSIGGRNIRLFGVRLADPRDRCGLGTGDNRSCNEVARDALAQRLQHYPNVACRVPPGQRRGVSGAICTDNSGTDLGGFLVAEGYALADTGQSYDYFGAEGAARSFHRGLWRYR